MIRINYDVRMGKRAEIDAKIVVMYLYSYKISFDTLNQNHFKHVSNQKK